MGSRGPVPNRSEDLARPRERKGGDQKAVTPGILRPVTIPEPDSNWHPIALGLWQSAQTSGQADFYQDTDWHFMFSLMDDLSEYKKSGRRSAQMLQAINAAMTSLLFTEGDRRRAGIELSVPDNGDEAEADGVVDDYENQLGLAPVVPITKNQT